MQDYSRFGGDLPENGLQRWLHQIYQRVWSSFTAAGNQISSAEFYEVVPSDLRNEWVEGRPRIAIAERHPIDDITNMEDYVESKFSPSQ